MKYLLATTPIIGLRVLKSAVAKHPYWSITSNNDEYLPRFTIDVVERYTGARYKRYFKQFQIRGSLQQAGIGETDLKYDVTGEFGPSLAGNSNFFMLLFMAPLLVGMLLFKDVKSNAWIGGALLFGVVVCAGYVEIIRRNYQRRLSAVENFMKTFARQMGAE